MKVLSKSILSKEERIAQIEGLDHIVKSTRNRGSVLVLDTGALIQPETQAMLAARYSRSVKGAQELIRELVDRDSGKFMQENYQAGYGDKSIGELGEAAVFIDGVSMLVAEAVEHFPLYRGQESSTRYIDFAKQPFFDVISSGSGDPEHWRSHGRGVTLLEKLRAFYLQGLPRMQEHYEMLFPQLPEYDPIAYKKAIKAKAFDCMRAFLPCGATTNVALVCDLRHLNDHLTTLRNHPLEEVRDVAHAVEWVLAEKYPNSFGFSRHDESELYLKDTASKVTYLHESPCPDFVVLKNDVDTQLLLEYQEVLAKRPRKTELPFDFRECGTLRFQFTLDFGSFRDLQRQRSVVTRMPLVTADLGFEWWYLSQMPVKLREEAVAFLKSYLKEVDELKLDPLQTQYYLPMGMKCAVRMTGDLRALTYITELRASRFVHPTLRKRAFQIAEVLLRNFSPYGLTLYVDKDPDTFDVKRGMHDIVKK